LFSKRFYFYKDLFLNTFNITNIVNKVSVKYITKNIKTDVREVFLEIKNHTRASIISSRNLRLTETSVCIVCESDSRSRPLKNIIRVIAEIAEKDNERIRTSLRKRFIPNNDLINKSVAARIILKKIRTKT
jgi:hypothetical protein